LWLHLYLPKYKAELHAVLTVWTHIMEVKHRREEASKPKSTISAMISGTNSAKTANAPPTLVRYVRSCTFSFI
jgi:hypothetical protein